MSWLATQLALLDAATAVVQFAVNWFLQSALLIAIGLATGRVLAGRGSAVQSAVYRTTLLAVLVCPLASCFLSLAGVSGWSLVLPRPWTGEPASVIVADTAVRLSKLSQSSRPAIADAVSIAPSVAMSDSPQRPTTAIKAPLSPAVDPALDDGPPAVAGQSPVSVRVMPPRELPTVSVHVFGWVALGICAVWLMITAVMLARLGVGCWRMAQLRRGAVPVDVFTWQTCHELARQLAVGPPELRRSPYLPSPCLAGIRRPVVLLPEIDLGLSIRDVLVHELAHLVRRDCHWNLLRLSTLSAFFFQPLLWKLSRRLEMTAEEVCDDYVVQHGGDRLEYAYRLVDIAELCTAPMATAGVGIVSLRSMLARRVQRIMDPSRPLSTRAGSLLLTLVLAAGLVGTVIVGLIGIGPKRSDAEVAPAAVEDKPQDQPAESPPLAAPTETAPVTAPAETTAAPTTDSRPPAGDIAPPPVPSEVSATLVAALPTAVSINLPAVRPFAIRPPVVETTAAALAPVASTTTVSFDRDCVQFTPSPFQVWSIAFSGNGQFLAASGGGPGDQNAGQARIWDFGKAKEIAFYPTLRGNASVSFSPDGRRIALGSWGGEISMREVGGAELLHEKLDSHVRAVFSPDGKLLVAATERGQLRTWDGVTGKPIENGQGAFHGGTFPFFWVGFSPDGNYLAACGGKGTDAEGAAIAVWSVPSRQQLYKKRVDLVRINSPLKRLAIFSAAISPDSQTLATGGENSIALWDLATGVRRSETEDSGGLIHNVEFSPDGKLLASASYKSGYDVTLWDPSTGKSVGRLKGHQDQIRTLAFTPDGKTLATGGSDRTIRLWDVATRQQTGMPQGPKIVPIAGTASGAIVAAAYSPDGDGMATASDNGEVNVYGPAPQGLSRTWTAHSDAAAAIAWSPDGKTLVTAGYDKLIKFWNPATGELIRTVAGHTGWVVSLAFSHDGQTLASGSYDRSIRLWNVADGLERRSLTGHAATIRSLAFSHNDKFLASASADRTVRLWDAVSGQQQASLAGHAGGVRSVAFSADDRLLASGGEDQTIKVWNVDSHDLHGTLTGHADMVSAVAFVRQTLVSTSWDKTFRTWDADTLEPRAKLTVGPSEVVAMAVAPDGRRMLTVAADQSLTRWKATVIEGQRGGALGDYRTFPWTADFSPDGTSLAVAAGGFEEQSDLYLYDVATKAQKYSVTFPDSVRCIAFAPAGDVIALAFARKKLLLVDAATGREVAQLEEQPADAPPGQRIRYTRVAFSPDGKLLAASSYDDDIRIYDVEHRTLVKVLKGRSDRVWSFAFSPDQKRLLSCSAAKSAVVWDLENAEKYALLPSPPGYVGVASVSYSPDGKLMATGYSKDICCVRHVETGSVLQTLQAHAGIVFESIFSPDGKLLATAGEDGLVKLWDVATGKLLRTYCCHSGPALFLRFSPDGKSFVTAGRDGQARLWWVLPPETT